MSVDHKPDLALEHARIAREGGIVAARSRTNPTYRVYDSAGRGGLAMARALGDTFYAGAVPALADVRQFALAAGAHSAVVVATDGLWDVLDKRAACDLVRARRAAAGGDEPNDIARRLVKLALNLNTSDNTSAVVVLIDPPSKETKNEKAEL